MGQMDRVGTKVGRDSPGREVKERPLWPGNRKKPAPTATAIPPSCQVEPSQPLRVQFLACDVGRGLDLRGQYKRIKSVIERSPLSRRIRLKAEFDLTDANLFGKLSSFRPNVVHISGNQNGGDVLLPSHEGGEIVVQDSALAGLFSSLGNDLRLAFVDTCESYQCAKRIAEVVDCAIGVNAIIYDDEASRFYEVFYQALGAGHSVSDSHGQATAALRFMKVPTKRIPKLCFRPGHHAKQLFLLSAK